MFQKLILLTANDYKYESNIIRYSILKKNRPAKQRFSYKNQVNTDITGPY